MPVFANTQGGRARACRRARRQQRLAAAAALPSAGMAPQRSQEIDKRLAAAKPHQQAPECKAPGHTTTPEILGRPARCAQPLPAQQAALPVGAPQPPAPSASTGSHYQGLGGLQRPEQQPPSPGRRHQRDTACRLLAPTRLPLPRSLEELGEARLAVAIAVAAGGAVGVGGLAPLGGGLLGG